MRPIVFITALALGFVFLSSASSMQHPTPQVDAALGDGWSRVHNPAP